MELFTENLRFRPLLAADAPELHRILTDAHVREYLCDGNIVSPEWSQEQARASEDKWRRHGAGLGLVFLPDREAPIGLSGFLYFETPPGFQILYAILPEFCGRGLATEISEAAARYAFSELGWREVKSAIDEPNAASRRVMEKLGAKVERREAGPKHLLYYYRLLPEDLGGRGRYRKVE